MKTPRKEIMLQNTAAGIMAHWMSNGRPDAETVRLFGTHIIPTAYTSTASMARVADEIKKRNPGYTVSII
jgi:hypothetical protein